METIVLHDKNIKPTEEIIFSIIGDKQILWNKLMTHLFKTYEGVTQEWNYYNDGKSWLFRTLRKKKTIFWIRILEKTFRVGFWFGEKAEPFIEQSNLPESIKNEYRNAKRYKIGRGISIEINSPEDIDLVMALIELKLKMK